MPSSRAARDVLGGDVGLGAVGGDADRADAEVVGVLELVGWCRRRAAAAW